MLDAFRRHLEERQILPARSRILVGYSGGADSACLLHLLHKLEYDVVAGHLHHGLRAEADEEQQRCEEFCNALGIPFATGRADVGTMSKDLKIGQEEAGRRARYAFFQQAAFRLNCNLIATAHTKSDHVETVLLNLVRGAGLHGLGGIPEVRENIVRPLLCFKREETRAYCIENGLWFHDDPSNVDLSFSRARIRHRVIPELEAINPSAQDTVSRMAEIVSEEDRFLDSMAAAALEQSEEPLNGALKFLTLDCEVAFDRKKLESLPPTLFRRGLRLAAQALGSKLDREQVLTIEQSLASGENGSITLEGGEIVIEWSGARIHFRQLKPTVPFRSTLDYPGETISDEFGWQFTARQTSEIEQEQRRISLEVSLPLKSIQGSLYFRTAQPGDTMTPWGFSGKRKLADLLSESKLTVAARGRLPIVCDMVGPLWAPGVCLDARAASTSASESAIFVSFGPVLQDPSHNMETSGNAETYR